MEFHSTCKLSYALTIAFLLSFAGICAEDENEDTRGGKALNANTILFINSFPARVNVRIEFGYKKDEFDSEKSEDERSFGEKRYANGLDFFTLEENEKAVVELCEFIDSKTESPIDLDALNLDEVTVYMKCPLTKLAEENGWVVPGSDSVDETKDDESSEDEGYKPRTVAERDRFIKQLEHNKLYPHQDYNNSFVIDGRGILRVGRVFEIKERDSERRDILQFNYATIKPREKE
ncbi:MAG: hypothetical protein K2Y18_01505 [Alphaproteobacteria bacterium]|jgi:hypothetical protein|nr:hypothetical protein [Alphaproteobacteria bacterium]